MAWPCQVASVSCSTAQASKGGEARCSACVEKRREGAQVQWRQVGSELKSNLSLPTV